MVVIDGSFVNCIAGMQQMSGKMIEVSMEQCLTFLYLYIKS